MLIDSSYWKVKEDSVVTIIIAAYLRHEPLNIALKSIYQQTYPHWQVLVIADCCDKSFKDNIDLSDNRVKFINLPKRNRKTQRTEGRFFYGESGLLPLSKPTTTQRGKREAGIFRIKQTRGNLALLKRP